MELLVHTNDMMFTLDLKLKSGTMTGTRSACIIDYQLPSRAGVLFGNVLVLLRGQEERIAINLPLCISSLNLIHSEL